MNRVEPSFSFGIEEKYFVVDQESRDLATLPPQLLSLLKISLGQRFSEEYLRAQIEISTPICASSLQARRWLVYLRQSISNLASPRWLSLTPPHTRLRVGFSNITPIRDATTTSPTISSN